MINKSHCLDLALKYDLETSIANRIIDEVEDATSHWSVFAQDAGVGKPRRDNIARRLADIFNRWR